MLALGLILGGGIMHTGWILRSAGKSDVSDSRKPAENASARPLPSRPSPGPLLQSKDRTEEKARLLAAKDPRAAWRQSLEITNFAERAAFLSGLMREWGRQDPAAALEMAGTLPAGQLKQEAFDAACAGWASQQPEAAAQWAAGHLSGPLAGEAFGMIAREWATNDPAAAAVWVSSLPGGVISAGATAAVIHAWAEQDPLAAAKWIDSFSDAGQKDAALATLASAWSAQSPAEAAKWVDSRLGTPGGGELAEALIGTWGVQDPYAASQWVMTLHEDVQGDAAAMLLSLWASSDPKVAADWAAQFPEGETRTQAIPSIAATWAGSEPENAVSWALALPDSPEQRAAVDDAVRTWTAVSPGTLGTWVEQQAANEATDRLRTIAAGTLVESHPRDALAMAAKITDPAKRNDSLTRLLIRWGRRDPAAAKIWAAQAALPPAVTGRLHTQQDGQP